MAELNPKSELRCQMDKNDVSAFWYIELNCSPREFLCLCRIERERKKFGTIRKLDEVKVV